MIEFRTSPLWRVLYWAITVVQGFLLSVSLSGANTVSTLIAVALFGIFFLLALQSRSPVSIGPDGIADDRVMIRRAWTWDTIDSVEARSPSLVRPEVVIRNGKGRVLPLNLRGLIARRDGEVLDRTTAIDGVIRLARSNRVTTSDDR